MDPNRKRLALIIGAVLAAVAVVVGVILATDRDKEPTQAQTPMATAVAPGGSLSPSVSPSTTGAGDGYVDHTLATPAAPTPTVGPGEQGQPSGDSVPTQAAESPLAEMVDPDLAMDPDQVEFEMAPEVEDPEQAAYDFAEAWLDNEKPQEAWLEGLRPHVTDYAYDNFHYVAEEHMVRGTLRLVNVGRFEEGVYEIPFRVFIKEQTEPVADGTMTMNPDGTWAADRIFEANTLDW